VLRYATLPAADARTIVLRPNLAGWVTRSSDTPGARGSVTEHVAYVARDQKTVELLLGVGAEADTVISNISLTPGEFTGISLTRIQQTCTSQLTRSAAPPHN
jgi:hypothetical protein